MTSFHVTSHCIFYFAAHQTSFLYCPPRIWKISEVEGCTCVCVKIYHFCHSLHLQDVEEVQSHQSSEPQRPPSEQTGLKRAKQGCKGAPIQHWHMLSMSRLASEPWSSTAWLHRNKFLLSHCSHHNQNRFKLFHSKNNSDQETLCQITGRGSSFLFHFLNLVTLIYCSHMDMRIFRCSACITVWNKSMKVSLTKKEAVQREDLEKCKGSWKLIWLCNKCK